jgi:hypothetical protein
VFLFDAEAQHLPVEKTLALTVFDERSADVPRTSATPRCQTTMEPATGRPS